MGEGRRVGWSSTLDELLFYSILCLAFSREHTIRLENAYVLKAIFQSGFISDQVITK